MPFLGNSTDRVRDGRVVKRDPALMAASLLILERSYCAAITHVTAEGARLMGCGDVQAGETLWIKVGCLDRLVTVAERDGDLCVVSFDEPLDRDDMIHLRCEARNTLVMRLAPSEKAVAQDWISGMKR